MKKTLLFLIIPFFNSFGQVEFLGDLNTKESGSNPTKFTKFNTGVLFAAKANNTLAGLDNLYYYDTIQLSTQKVVDDIYTTFLKTSDQNRVFYQKNGEILK